MILACAKEKYNRIRFELFESAILPIAERMDVYYLFGQSENTPVIPSHKNVHMIIAPCKDNWEDIPMKVYHGFTHLGNFGYDYIMKIDENITIKNPSLLITQVESEITAHPYIALKDITPPGDCSQLIFSYYHIGKCSNKVLDVMPAVMTNITYAGGPGYVLGRGAYLKLKKELFKVTLFEDFCIGFNLYLFNITPFIGETSKQKLLSDPDNILMIKPIPTISYNYKDYIFKLMRTIPYDTRTLYMSINGGLGNQLFQLATGMAYASTSNRKLLVFSSATNGRKYYWNTLLSRFNSIHTDITKISFDKRFREPSFLYSPIPEFSENTLLIDGYFQSAMYFNNIRHILKKILLFPMNIREMLSRKYKIDLWKPNFVVVHARRGDYVSASDYHALQPDEYYNQAKKLIETKITEPTYILISDDPEYWKRSTVFCDSKVIHFEEDDIETFYLIMNSYNIIMANSTFSWWGSYLSEATNVIAPKLWFATKGPHDWSSIYVDGWNIL